MENFKQILELEFYNIISNFLNEKQLQFKYRILSQPNLSDYTIETILKNKIVSFLILKGNYPYIIVEVREQDMHTISNRNYAQGVFFELELIGADYYVVTNLNETIVYNDTLKKITVSKQFNSIFSLFREKLNNRYIAQLKKKIANEIIRIIDKYELSDEQKLVWQKSVKNFLLEKKLLRTISYNREGRFFHFMTNPELGLEDFENQFFQMLLEPVTEEFICRYTTFESLYHIINSKSYRMGSNIAMNDRGEIDYVDKYIGTFYKPLQVQSLKELQQMNNSYISSCTTVRKEDDLTMYRLYGEDSKGVCLRFCVANGLQSKYMLVKKISYAKSKGNHPELDLIKNIINSLSSSFSVRFRFINLDTWKHFFKTHDYSIEEEIRVLYLDNPLFALKDKGWIITNPDKILSKYVVFDLNNMNFPLTLSKIILGPNCPDAQLNRRQIEVFLQEKSIKDVTVENSTIESYRKN